jgi:hypothetical protein
VFHFSAACAFANHLFELIIPFSRLDISTQKYTSSLLIAMKLIATLLVALKIFTATAQDADLPPCPDDIVTRDDCHAWCQAELDSLPGGSWTNGWKDITGGIGNISGCVCTADEAWKGSLNCDLARDRDGKEINACDKDRIPKNKRPGGPIDFSCSRTPTPPPPMPPQKRTFCEKQRRPLNSLEDCQAFCVDYRRFPRAFMNANGMLTCECLDGRGGDVEWWCGTKTPNYLRSG